jgi:hypothetical protein
MCDTHQDPSCYSGGACGQLQWLEKPDRYFHTIRKDVAQLLE